jgi:probable HAF family extracellular repeat protein
MTGLGTLPGDLRSDARAINSTGHVVGLSYASSSLGFSQAGKAFVWQDGVMSPIAGSTDFIDINDRGMIIRHESSGDAYLLVPDSIPTLAINDVSLIEGNTGTSPANFTITLSAASTQSVTVNYTTADGTATAESDYQAVSGAVTFAPGETSKTIAVPVFGDRLAEPIENFLVNLSSPMNALVTRAQAVATILDDEPRISISDTSMAEGKKGQTTRFTFTVSLSAAYDQAVTMSFRTVDGTASLADKDYLSQTGTLTFNPGETQKTITITVNGDSKKEGNETFYLDLFGNSSNSLFTKSRGIGTILNDD